MMSKMYGGVKKRLGAQEASEKGRRGDLLQKKRRKDRSRRGESDHSNSHNRGKNSGRGAEREGCATTMSTGVVVSRNTRGREVRQKNEEGENTRQPELHSNYRKGLRGVRQWETEGEAFKTTQNSELNRSVEEKGSQSSPGTTCLY